MYSSKFRVLFAATLIVPALFACATDVAIYDAPSAGPMSTITFANATEHQNATLIAFDDADACVGRRYMHFDNDRSIPPGDTRTTTLAAEREFALLATLNTVENEAYAIELGVTGSGPEPVLSRGFTAIGCNALVSFPVEPDKDYYVVVSGPETAGTCSVAVSEIFSEGMILPVQARKRTRRETWGEPRSFCEPIDE